VLLHARHWGEPSSTRVVCLHGITQHGGIFAGLGERLAERGLSVTALDLRGHGKSSHDPPWTTEHHCDDVTATLASLEVERAIWVGHSFGGRLAATLASSLPERTDGLVLLDPGLSIPSRRALRGAEMDRQDWNFATVDGAINAVMASDTIERTPRETVAEFVRDDLKKGPDDRYRFSYCPSAVVVAWSEMTLPAPEIALVDTLVVRAGRPLFDEATQVGRYAKTLGTRLTAVTVPGAHNVLWESPEETIQAVEGFVSQEAIR
jgi:lipase